MSVICPKCGNQLPEGAKFCGSCGTNLAAFEKPPANVCTNCGNPLKEGAKFCNVCGTKIMPAAEQTPAPEPVPQPVVEQPVTEPPVTEQPVSPAFTEDTASKQEQPHIIEENPTPQPQTYSQPAYQQTQQQTTYQQAPQQNVYQQQPVYQQTAYQQPQNQAYQNQYTQPLNNDNAAIHQPYPDPAGQTVTPGKKPSVLIPIILIILILAVIAVDVFVLFPDRIFGNSDESSAEESVKVTYFINESDNL